MTIYLPIAEIPVNIFLLMFIGMAGGILAGMFGVGGGFLITPILIFIGIPPSVAVATSSNQIIASSSSGFFSYWYRRAVDIKMGFYLIIGGIVGSLLGVVIFAILKTLGQIDLAISLIYVLFLGLIGTIMAWESGNAIFKKKVAINTVKVDSKLRLPMVSQAVIILRKIKTFINRIELPYEVDFPKSGIRVSVIMPIVIGLVSGILVSLMGIGGGFVLIPAMLYILKMPASTVAGTSLFQTIFTTCLVTVMHSVSTHSVDVVLALTLIIGGVFGAQIGSRFATRVSAEKLRLALAIIILSLCVRLAVGLFFQPKEIYTIEKIAD